MQHVLLSEQDTLCALSQEHSPSPEDFLIDLEERLEAGDITIDEAIIIINDYNTRTPL